MVILSRVSDSTLIKMLILFSLIQGKLYKQFIDGHSEHLDCEQLLKDDTNNSPLWESNPRHTAQFKPITLIHYVTRAVVM